MPCPYPDCPGQITAGQNFCTTCGRPLDPASVAAARSATVGLSQPTTPIQQYQTQPYQYPAQPTGPQYPPPQQLSPPAYVQNNWPPQSGYPQGTMPVQPVALKSGGTSPFVILLVVLVVLGCVVAGYFAFSGKLTVSVGAPPSNASGTSGTSGASSSPLQPRSFNLQLPVFDRDNNFVSDPIEGSNGMSRRLSMAALPYSVVANGQTSGMTSLEVAIQKGDNPDFSNDSTIMSINFVTAQGLADSLTSEMNSKYPGADYQILVPAKGHIYQISDSLGWALKITVDDLALDNGATMSDGTASPYPVFTTFNLTAEVTPK